MAVSDLASHPVGRGPTTADPSVARSMHTAAVVTPEAVLLEFRAAGIASRLMAKGIDLILQFLVIYALIIVGAIVTFLDETIGIVTITVSIFLVFFGYPAIEAVWNGQTLGKKIFGIKVITIEGGPVRFRHAAIRSMVWVVEFMIPPGGLIALTVALLTKQSQRLGDLAAGTMVVRSTKIQTNPVFFPPAMGAEDFSITFDAGRLSAHDYALIREFLMRAHELTPGARQHVAAVLSEAVEQAAARPRPPEVDSERYLVSAVFAYQQRFAPAGAAVPAAPPRAPTMAPTAAPTMGPSPGVQPPPPRLAPPRQS